MHAPMLTKWWTRQVLKSTLSAFKYVKWTLSRTRKYFIKLKFSCMQTLSKRRIIWCMLHFVSMLQLNSNRQWCEHDALGAYITN